MSEILDFIERNKKYLLFYSCLFLCIVFLSVISYAAEGDDSSFVQSGEFTSYEGLPSFPTSDVVSISSGKKYVKFNDYILYRDSVSCVFYLACISSIDGDLYIDDSMSVLRSTGDYLLYSSNSFSSLYRTYENTCFVSVYSCALNGDIWEKDCFYQDTFSVYKYDTIIDSSCSIFMDLTLSEVFFSPEVGPSLLGLTPEEITKMTTKEMVGLIPLAIGLVVLVMGFLKGWSLLKTAFRGL